MNKYRYIIECHSGYAGSDAYVAVSFPEKPSEKELSEAAWEIAVDNADGFGIYPYPDDIDIEEEDEDNYSQNIEGVAHEYVPELHDMRRCGGGSFKTDFIHGA